MRVPVLVAGVAGGLGFWLGRLSVPAPPPPAPQEKPSAWDEALRRQALHSCQSDTINVLGYKGCNSYAFCRCAVARAVASGMTPEAWDAQSFEIAAKAYHNAVGHPCTAEAVKACNGWSD